MRKKRTFLSAGDKVFLNNEKCPDGKYNAGFLYNIHVKESKTIDITFF